MIRRGLILRAPPRPRRQKRELGVHRRLDGEDAEAPVSGSGSDLGIASRRPEFPLGARGAKEDDYANSVAFHVVLVHAL
jgi:hypothetical protein